MFPEILEAELIEQTPGVRNMAWSGADTVEISASNATNEIVKPGGIDRSFFLVLSNGQLLERELFVTFPQNFYDVQMIPGGTGVGQVAFALPKSGASTSKLLVIRDRSNFLKTADYYFQVNW